MENFKYDFLPFMFILLLIWLCTAIIKNFWQKTANTRHGPLKLNSQKILLHQYKWAFILTPVIFTGLIYIIYIHAATAIDLKIEYFKYFIINQIQYSQNEFFNLQNILALHGYAIISSSCFMLGLYFITNSGRFN